MSKLKLILTVRPIWLLLVVAALALIIGLLIPVTPDFRGPIVDINDTIMIAILVALGGFIANLYLQRGQDLARIGKLEDNLKAAQQDFQASRDQNDTLRSDLAAAASFINRVGYWITQGMPASKRPRPPKQLDEHGVDMDPWDDEMPIGGTDD